MTAGGAAGAASFCILKERRERAELPFGGCPRGDGVSGICGEPGEPNGWAITRDPPLVDGRVIIEARAVGVIDAAAPDTWARLSLATWDGDTAGERTEYPLRPGEAFERYEFPTAGASWLVFGSYLNWGGDTDLDIAAIEFWECAAAPPLPACELVDEWAAADPRLELCTEPPASLCPGVSLTLDAPTLRAGMLAAAVYAAGEVAPADPATWPTLTAVGLTFGVAPGSSELGGSELAWELGARDAGPLVLRAETGAGVSVIVRWIRLWECAP